MLSAGVWPQVFGMIFFTFQNTCEYDIQTYGCMRIGAGTHTVHARKNFITEKEIVPKGVGNEYKPEGYESENILFRNTGNTRVNVPQG